MAENCARHLASDPGAAEGLDAFAERRATDFARFDGGPS
jgi:hypothetical protein